MSWYIYRDEKGFVRTEAALNSLREKGTFSLPMRINLKLQLVLMLYCTTIGMHMICQKSRLKQPQKKKTVLTALR